MPGQDFATQFSRHLHPQKNVVQPMLEGLKDTGRGTMIDLTKATGLHLEVFPFLTYLIKCPKRCLTVSSAQLLLPEFTDFVQPLAHGQLYIYSILLNSRFCHHCPVCNCSFETGMFSDKDQDVTASFHIFVNNEPRQVAVAGNHWEVEHPVFVVILSVSKWSTQPRRKDTARSCVFIWRRRRVQPLRTFLEKSMSKQ